MRTFLVVAALLLAVANAQVATQGRLRLRGSERSEVFSLGFIDNQALLKSEDKSHGGYEFARPIDVNLNAGSNGVWTTRHDGTRVWKLTIKSETALSLSLTFNSFRLPEGGEFYVYGESKVRGAFTSKNNKKHGWFSVAPIEGNTITLEYLQPAEVKDEPVISLFKVSHGFKTLAFGSSGRCNVNTVCAEADAWRNQIRGVVMMLTQFGSRYCSGSMINNANNDGKQYYLTANHCVGGNVASDQVMFNYESPVCALASQQDGPTSYTAQGLTALANFAQSDFYLFEVEEEIPDSYNVFLNGFNANNVAPVNMVGIHHPSGDIKKISFANKTGVATSWSEAPRQYHWEVTFWDLGTTEPGSSGSPLFGGDQLIVGQLHGGAASCTNTRGYDSYGAVWASWDQGTSKLQTYLDPKNTGARTVKGINLASARKNAQLKL